MQHYNKIIKLLLKKKVSVSIAESCTGGQLSKIFTDFPGISKIFNAGLITYSNKSKNKLLNVPFSNLIKNGAVSEDVSILMAKNLYKITKSKLCISTTGIAGPTGGTKNKPVGLIFITIKYGKKIYTFKKIFKGSREKIQKQSVFFCLEKINDLI